MCFRRPFRILSVGATTILVIVAVALLSPADAWMGNSNIMVPPQSSSSPSSTPRTFLSQQQKQEMTRRNLLVQSFIVSTVGVAVMGAKKPVAHAASIEEELLSKRNTSTFYYQRQVPNKKSYTAYQISLPDDNNGTTTFSETQKPVKTHLDEVNLVSSEIKGYQYGITVDPVRINSLKEFGTPEEVAARVVTAEVNRDGIFEVTLMEDPLDTGDGAYLLHYLSTGKRGNKHYFNKIVIANQLLYVVTAQCKEADYPSLEKELRKTVSTFQLVQP